MWNYEIVFVKEQQEFIIAEVYFDNSGNPQSFCTADIAEETEDKLKEILKTLLHKLTNGIYYDVRFNQLVERRKK